MAFPPLRDAAALLLSALSSRAPAPKREFADLPVQVQAVTAPTRHGPVRCTVLRATSAGERPPVHVNVHGGGFVIGMPLQDDAWCRYLAVHSGVVVVNVDYATAPRVRFPIAIEQVRDVVRWAADPDRAWDGSRLTIGGQSAGGSISAAVARLALEQGAPAIALQVLHYPVLDLATPPQDKPMPVGHRSVPPLWMSTVFNGAYLPVRSSRRDRLASPAWGGNAEGLAGIAPAVVVTAEFDRLRAEGLRYAAALDAAGALVEHLEAPGVGHGYDIVAESPEVTRTMYAALAAHVAGRWAAA